MNPLFKLDNFIRRSKHEESFSSEALSTSTGQKRLNMKMLLFICLLYLRTSDFNPNKIIPVLLVGLLIIHKVAEDLSKKIDNMIQASFL
jgi:hypothetical protein